MKTLEPVVCTKCQYLDQRQVCRSPVFNDLPVKIDKPDKPEPCSGYQQKQP